MQIVFKLHVSAIRNKFLHKISASVFDHILNMYWEYKIIAKFLLNPYQNIPIYNNSSFEGIV